MPCHFKEVVEFEMDSEQRVSKPNPNKAMSEKQRGYIERLLFDRNIDESYKQMIRNAMQDGLSSLQASKIIDFLKACIEFKQSFSISLAGQPSGNVFGKSSFGRMPAKVVEEKESQLKI